MIKKIDGKINIIFHYISEVIQKTLNIILMSSSSRFNSQPGSQPGSQPNRNYGSRKPTSSSPSHSSQPSSAGDGEDTKFRPSAGGGGWGRPRGSSHLPSQPSSAGDAGGAEDTQFHQSVGGGWGRPRGSPPPPSQPSSAGDAGGAENIQFHQSIGGRWGRPKGSSHLSSQSSSAGGGGWRRPQGSSHSKIEADADMRPNFAAAIVAALLLLPFSITPIIADDFTATYVDSHALLGAYTSKDIQDAVDCFIRKRRESSRFQTRGRSDRQNDPPENKVYVGNLPPSCTKSQLNELFRRFGQVITINIIHQKQCAFVTFSNSEDAAKALSQANGYVFLEADKSYEIRVDFIRENTAFKAGGGETKARIATFSRGKLYFIVHPLSFQQNV
jgi:hypothetical protein